MMYHLYANRQALEIGSGMHDQRNQELENVDCFFVIVIIYHVLLDYHL